MRSVRFLLLAFVLGIAPAVASAEPISFTSQIRSGTAPDPNGTAGTFTLTHTAILPSSLDPPGTPEAIYATLHLVPTSLDQPLALESVPGATTFWFEVNLTDSESGQSGSLRLLGSAGTGITFDGTELVSTHLGSNTYTLRGLVDPPTEGGSQTGTIRLGVIPTPLNTPEPGTLVLASLGLLPALGLVRRRRS